MWGEGDLGADCEVTDQSVRASSLTAAIISNHQTLQTCTVSNIFLFQMESHKSLLKLKKMRMEDIWLIWNVSVDDYGDWLDQNVWEKRVLEKCNRLASANCSCQAWVWNQLKMEHGMSRNRSRRSRRRTGGEEEQGQEESRRRRGARGAGGEEEQGQEEEQEEELPWQRCYCPAKLEDRQTY